MKNEYLGDSVYIEFDGITFEIYTRNEGVEKKNLIYLEKSVAINLLEYIDRILNVGDSK